MDGCIGYRAACSRTPKGYLSSCPSEEHHNINNTHIKLNDLDAGMQDIVVPLGSIKL